ncbi:JmjC domain, hydroxylase-domain-containing protein [Crassisporium funariophilum]|nr:JmjC domain, hydroxylase-domain-containing protein [Crassisporium funariophilum]
MASVSRGSTLTPCRSPTPEIPVQPDHFYGAENIQLPPSPDSDGKTWLDPADDPLAHRGIPVFKPTMEEFKDFEGYMNKVECWGSRSGIVKVIPPKEWTASLPAIEPQLAEVKIKTPIEQNMLGSGGLFRQENMEKRKVMSVREWVELCKKDEFKAPGVQDVGLTSRSANGTVKSKVQRRGKQKAATVKAEASGPASVEVMIKAEPLDDCQSLSSVTRQPVATPPNSEGTPPLPVVAAASGKKKKKVKEEKPKPRAKRPGQTKEAREAGLADRAARDLVFNDTFNPHQQWLPPNTKSSDYTPEFCQKLERQFWRNCGLGKPAWYGADTQGSLFTDETKAWNVAHLPSALSRLLPSSDQGLPGVNTPYLYFGMWRATFAWHVEDMDLFSINYIHFGAPKFWYAIPQGRSTAMEQTMRGYFPKDTSLCPQFLRHKSFLASPNILANSACRPNYLVQQCGEFVITFPRGYHAGFNLGLNCAESVNFALESWLEVGRRAKACECISDSVRIDVDELLRQREEERNAPPKDLTSKRTTKKESSKKDAVKKEVHDGVLPPPKAPSRKRKSEVKDDGPKAKKLKIKPSQSKASTSTLSIRSPLPKISVTLKLGPRPVELEPFPCCLCISMSKDGLLRVHEPPINRKDALEATGNPKSWMAHEYCASVVPETWVDHLDDPYGGKEKVVFGVDGIVKDRWNLKCSACTKNKPKGHGAPVQCTKGKCPKAFHVNCAKDGHALGIIFAVVREVEKEVVLLDPLPSGTASISPDAMWIDSTHAAASDNPAVDSELVNHSSGSRVLKVIKKLDVQILCTQHNPAVAALKKASKQDKIRNDLMTLPTMTRIKIRVSAGVFEVSLIRVIEETSSVEVLWDRGIKREFKWGSVVFGSTDGPVQQKPSEIAVESERPASALPVTIFPSVAAATGQPTVSPYLGNPSAVPLDTSTVQANTTMKQHYGSSTQYMYPAHTGPYDYWTYASQYSGQGHYPYAYNGYYPNPMAGASQHYNPYSYAQAYNQNQYRGGQLHWQQPYQGPPQPQGSGATSEFSAGSTQLPPNAQGSSQTSTPQSYYRPSIPPPMESVQPSDEGKLASPDVAGEGTSSTAPQLPNAPAAPFPIPTATGPDPESVYKDLAALSSLQPSQIADILRSNPQLRDIVWAAVDQAKKADT